MKIIESVIHLLKEGSGFQRHTDENGKLYSLLKLRAVDVPELKDWITRRRKWLTHDIQNEIVSLVARDVQDQIRTRIQNCANFSIISDGTQDIEGHEQLSIVFRYVIDKFEIHEDFVGYYCLPDSNHIAPVRQLPVQ